MDGRLTGIRVDDFKYSASSSGLNRLLQQSLQIPLYAHLAATMLNAGPDVFIEGRYLLLRSPSTPVVTCTIDGPMLDGVRQRVEQLVDKVRRGQLHPDPADAQESVRTTGGGSFEIVAGQIVRGDQRVPATLKNVVDEPVGSDADPSSVGSTL